MSEEMTRAEAIEIVDETDFQYLEGIRTGVCPACEALIQVSEVEESEIPPERSELARRAEEYYEQKMDGNVKWVVKHLDDCSFAYYYKNLPKLCEVFNIRTVVEPVWIRFPNGKAWLEVAEHRDPDPGDPPLPF